MKDTSPTSEYIVLTRFSYSKIAQRQDHTEIPLIHWTSFHYPSSKQCERASRNRVLRSQRSYQ